jgi:hypothetical protein
MGLTFTVGLASTVFMQPFANQVVQELERQLGYSMPEGTPLGDEVYCSEELGWSGWQKLQERATAALGKGNVTNLLAMEAWQGVYLPAPIRPTEVAINGHDAPLQCGSLSALIRELDQFAKAGGLPTEKAGLEELWEKYMEDDDLIDEDMDIQTYVQLMLTAQVAMSHNLPLWVVK